MSHRTKTQKRLQKEKRKKEQELKQKRYLELKPLVETPKEAIPEILKVEEPIIEKQTMNTYNFGQGLLKGIKYFVLFLIPFALQLLPTEILNLTVGGIIVILYNFVKIKWLPKLI